MSKGAIRGAPHVALVVHSHEPEHNTMPCVSDYWSTKIGISNTPEPITVLHIPLLLGEELYETLCDHHCSRHQSIAADIV